MARKVRRKKGGQAPSSPPETVRPEPGVKLVINDGQRTVHSASLPVSWQLTADVIARKPGWAIIIEQDEGELHRYDEYHQGRRYLVPVTQLVQYIQFHSAGRHRLGIVILNESENNPWKYLARENNHYSESISLDQIAQGRFEPWPPRIAAGILTDIDIPEELFAVKPRTLASQWLWDWVNNGPFFGRNRIPRDQCDYRRRIMICVPLQFIVWAILLVLFALYALLLIVAPVFVLFMGYRPQSLVDIWEGFPSDKTYFLGVRADENYRVWRRENNDENGKPISYMPVTGFELVLFAGSFLLWRCLSHIHSHLALLGMVVCAFVFVSVTLVFVVRISLLKTHFGKIGEGLERLWNLVDDEWKKRQKDDNARKEQWLLTHLSMQAQPVTNEVTAYTKAQRFRVNFQRFKARVCRPYSRR